MKRLRYAGFSIMLALGFAGVTTATSTSAASAAPGHSAAAAACRHGGFRSEHRSDGSGFTNVGGCVSYAARGGTLEDLCQPGSWSTTGTAPCSPADVGYYVATAGATSETRCPFGYTTAGAGSTSESDCIPTLMLS